MAAETARAERSEPPRARAVLGQVRRGLSVPWRLLKGTVSSCMRYRVTGLAAEGAFFAVLSLPPLVFGLAGTLGYVVGIFGSQTVESVKSEIVEIARRALTEDSVQSVIVPTLDAVLDRGRADIISIGFVLALWSGSRALNVFIDTISIMHGQAGKRGIVKTRLLSFSMYIVALGIGVVVLPLVLAGPSIVAQILPPNLDFLNDLYWPVVLILSTAFVATLYHIAVPLRSPWLHDLPGSVLALAMWIGGSYLLRWVLGASIGGESTSIYGPLAAPIAVLLWLYLIVITLLIGAAFNATVHKLLEERQERRVTAARPPEPQLSAATVAELDDLNDLDGRDEPEEPEVEQPASGEPNVSEPEPEVQPERLP